MNSRMVFTTIFAISSPLSNRVRCRSSWIFEIYLARCLWLNLAFMRAFAYRTSANPIARTKTLFHHQLEGRYVDSRRRFLHCLCTNEQIKGRESWKTSNTSFCILMKKFSVFYVGNFSTFSRTRSERRTKWAQQRRLVAIQIKLEIMYS